MTERSTAKSKRPEDAKLPRKPVAARLPDDETARLKAELVAARARIADLEQKQADIINRIDWVIDSLHNLSD